MLFRSKLIVGAGGRGFLRIHDRLHPVVQAALEHIIVLVAQLPGDHPRLVGLDSAVGVEHVALHILVEDVDPASGSPRLRGVFSATQIGRLLGVPVQTFDLARTFGEIEAALAD